MENVYEVRGLWYFYDETGGEHGPYKSKEIACARSWMYEHWLMTGEEYRMEKRT